MDKLINTTIESPDVEQVAGALRLSNNQLWNLYYESGMEYLSLLAQRIKSKRFFDAQFRPMRTNRAFSRLSVSQALAAIRFSPSFWFWWATQVWSLCRRPDQFSDETELFYRLQFNSERIPTYILKRIFYEKNNDHAARTFRQHSGEALEADCPTSRIGGVAKHVV